LIILDAVMIGFTIMWLVVALGPDSLLDDECSAWGSTPCIKTHTHAWVWAVGTGALAIFLLVVTWRRFAKARAIEHDRKP
jgi:hypothetical protein